MLENKMFDEGKKPEVEAAALAGIKSPARPVKALRNCLSPRRPPKGPLSTVRRLLYSSERDYSSPMAVQGNFTC